MTEMERLEKSIKRTEILLLTIRLALIITVGSIVIMWMLGGYE